MNRYFFSIVMFLLCHSHLGGATPQFSDADLKKMLTQVDELWRGKSSEGQLTMKVKTSRYERSISMQMWSRGQDFFLIRILSPKKERGTATLKRDDQIYNYLPKVKRTIKIGAAMMGGSWMGSHFTNDDLVQSTTLAQDYTATLVSKTDSQLTIGLTPKPDAAVVWGKLEVTITYPGLTPIEQKFYSEDLKLVRTINFSDVRKVGSRQIPMRFRVTPEDKAGEFTELIYDNLKFDLDLDEAFFSLSNLKRMR